MTPTQILDVISIDPRFLVHTPPNPAILLVVVTVIVTIIHTDSMIALLLAQVSLYSGLMKLFNLAIILVCLLPKK